MKNAAEQYLDPEELAYNCSISESRRQFIAWCPDGVLRRGRCGVADTLFTIPARMTAMSRTISGFLTYEKEKLVFIPQGKHKEIFNG